jgi:thymidine kinase
MNIELFLGPMGAGKSQRGLELVHALSGTAPSYGPVIIRGVQSGKTPEWRTCVTHNGINYTAYCVSNTPQVIEFIDCCVDSKYNVVMIDELHFILPQNNPRAALAEILLALQLARVSNLVISTLDLDIFCRTMPAISELVRIAQRCTRLRSHCTFCDTANAADRTVLVRNNSQEILIPAAFTLQPTRFIAEGTFESNITDSEFSYRAICDNCFTVAPKVTGVANVGT